MESRDDKVDVGAFARCALRCDALLVLLETTFRLANVIEIISCDKSLGEDLHN